MLLIVFTAALFRACRRRRLGLLLLLAAATCGRGRGGRKYGVGTLGHEAGRRRRLGHGHALEAVAILAHRLARVVGVDELVAVVDAQQQVAAAVGQALHVLDVRLALEHVGLFVLVLLGRVRDRAEDALGWSHVRRRRVLLLLLLLLLLLIASVGERSGRGGRLCRGGGGG